MFIGMTLLFGDLKFKWGRHLFLYSPGDFIRLTLFMQLSTVLFCEFVLFVRNFVELGITLDDDFVICLLLLVPF